MTVWCDRIVTGGILFLILFTPLAFGSVHPWAFSLMEVVIFLLIIVWAFKLYLSPRSLFPSGRRFGWGTNSRPILLFLILFIGLISLQLLPLPPSLLRLLSASTYDLNIKSLPGWPERMPYQEPSFQKPDSKETSNWVVLPTPDEVQKGAPVPFSSSQSVAPDFQFSASSPSLDLWRPLSIAPILTRSDLLKFCSYVFLFFLVLLYPFGPPQEANSQQLAVSGRLHVEERFVRPVLRTVLFSGLLVAFIGLVQLFTWNGKILWFFVPYDWGIPHPGITAATGPFVSHVHFANYLSLVFPLALVGIFSHSFVAPQANRKSFRLFCGFTAFIVFVGVLLSLSRGGWIGIVLGIVFLLWMLLSLPEERRPFLLQRTKKSVVRFSLVGLSLLLIMALVFVGPSGRGQVDARLEETVLGERSLRTRVAVWEDSLGIIRDFPLFGVGLGSWQELFPRYRRPPWSPTLFREAHNDYLELLAETGLIGFFLLAGFFWQVGRKLFFSFKMLPPKTVPVSAALLSALGIMAFHEFFDFNLQIPANAFLFTLFLGIALRMTRHSETEGRIEGEAIPVSSPRRVAAPAVAVGAVSFVLMFFALRQEGLPYPNNLKEPASLAEARQVLLTYPARSSAHLSVFRLLEDRAPLSQRLRELEIAIWFDPINPYARDLYAASLFRQGREEKGLKEITQSVLFSPSLSTHFYLSHRLLPLLSAREQTHVEEGFKRALAFGNERVVSELGAFYAALHRFPEEGRLYENAALKESEAADQLHYLLKAGLAGARAGDDEKAEALFRQASAAVPQDPRAYQYLATRVFAPREDLDSVKAAISEGIKMGADPFSLSFSLAEAAQNIGNREEVKAALLQALSYRPSSFEAHYRLGYFYLQDKNFDRAALSLRRAGELNPSSASSFYHLGLAEEERYRFFAAEKAYARALELEPDHASFQYSYKTFLRKVAESGIRDTANGEVIEPIPSLTKEKDVNYK
ncbi:MAG: O-antigen ligase family protein [Candidatus Binatia bacterium]